MTVATGEAVRFLSGLAQVLSGYRLYDSGHPARRQAELEAYEALLALLEDDPEPVFTFLEDEVALGERRLNELGDWKWSGVLARAGIERIELRPGIGRDEFRRFVGDVHRRIHPGPGGRGELPAVEEYEHVRFGKLSLLEGRKEFSDVGLEEEAEAVAWLYETARTQGKVPATLAGAVALSIDSTLRRSHDVLDLLVPLRRDEQYGTVHTMNVALLSMALAEALGFTGRDARSLGEAAVLHDFGRVRIPEEILSKPDSLTDEEWEIVRQHPEEGARLLLRSDQRLDLAAVVAYEHHMGWAGGGYPQPSHVHRPHPVSQIIQICDVYDALRMPRPFREPWPREKILRHIRSGAGETFDPTLVSTFTEMLRRWDSAGGSGERGEGSVEASAEAWEEDVPEGDAGAGGRGEGAGPEAGDVPEEEGKE